MSGSAFGGDGRESPKVAQTKDPSDPWAYDAKTLPAQVPLELLPAFVDVLRNAAGRADHVFHGTLMVRKLLSVEHDPPIQAVIDAGAVSLLMPCLRGPSVELQFEACWALCNVASGTTAQMQVAIRAGFVPELVPLLDSPSEDVREQAAWTVGNIAGDGTETRDLLLQAGVMPPLLRFAACESPKITVMRNAMWALSNMIRVKPLPDWDAVVVPTLPLIASRLHHSDAELLADACWALSYATSKPATDQLQTVLDIEGLLPRVVHLLVASSSAPCHLPALKVIGNLVMGLDAQTQLVLDAGALQHFPSLLTLPKQSTVKEALWTLSNIAAGPASHVQSLLDANLLSRVIDLGSPGQPTSNRKEALWIVINMVAHGTTVQQLALIDAGVLPALCSGLSVVPESQSVLNRLILLLAANDDATHPPRDIAHYLDPDDLLAVQCAQREGDVQLSGLTMALMLPLMA